MLLKNDLEDDIALYLKERMPNFKPKIIFDVGANHGWFSYQFLRQYDYANFYCFEPVSVIFDKLVENLTRFPELNPFPRCNLIKKALGAHSSRLTMTAVPDVTTNRIIDASVKVAEQFSEIPFEAIDVATGDEFCKESGISDIDYLKIDAEGFDLKVLFGFERMLESQSIKFVQVEASLSSFNQEHTDAAVFIGLLRKFGYVQFRILNQA